jgi:hypothetical protein
LGDIAKKILRFKVGDGVNIHLWMDFWHPAGILLEIYEYKVVYDAQSSVEAKLSFVIHNGDWLWRSARSEALVKIQARLPEISLGLSDKPIWTASEKGIYVSFNTWDSLREKREQIDWCKLVWFPLAIRKHSFILCLAMKQRMVASDRLLNWGYQGDVKCSFCRKQLESDDHLFFLMQFLL